MKESTPNTAPSTLPTNAAPLSELFFFTEHADGQTPRGRMDLTHHRRDLDETRLWVNLQTAGRPSACPETFKRSSLRPTTSPPAVSVRSTPATVSAIGVAFSPEHADGDRRRATSDPRFASLWPPFRTRHDPSAFAVGMLRDVCEKKKGQCSLYPCRRERARNARARSRSRERTILEGRGVHDRVEGARHGHVEVALSAELGAGLGAVGAAELQRRAQPPRRHRTARHRSRRTGRRLQKKTYTKKIGAMGYQFPSPWSRTASALTQQW